MQKCFSYHTIFCLEVRNFIASWNTFCERSDLGLNYWLGHTNTFEATIKLPRADFSVYLKLIGSEV